MRRLTTVLFLGVIVLALAGAAFLATWEIPPPKGKIEKPIPNERFPR